MVVFYANRDKIICHLYNTTQHILVYGHGYSNFIKLFLKPFFDSKLSLNQEDIASYNKKVLETLGPKQVKRSTVKYKRGSSFPCKVCDFSAKTLASLNKHKDNGHALSFNSSKSISSCPPPLRQSTRNNSISEALLQENISSTNISNQNQRITIQENALKYTCLECNFATSEKGDMNDHVINIHDCTGLKNMNFVCRICNNEFNGEDEYNTHVKTHESEETSPQEAHELSEENHQIHKCEECNHEFQNIIDLKAHTESVHTQCNTQVKDSTVVQPTPDVEITSCTLCDFDGNNKDELEAHLKANHSSSDYREEVPIAGNQILTEFFCKFCDFTAVQECDLNGHTCKNQRVSQCPKCEETFSNPDT